MDNRADKIDFFMSEHQSKLKPADNKFHKGNGEDQKHYWLTPPDLYENLNSEFKFDFDPCPFPLPEGFEHNGKKKGPTAWIRKAIEENKKGKTVVLVYPVDKWVLMILAAIGTEVRNLGDVKWVATEDGSSGKGTGRHIACFILRGHDQW